MRKEMKMKGTKPKYDWWKLKDGMTQPEIRIAVGRVDKNGVMKYPSKNTVHNYCWRKGWKYQRFRKYNWHKAKPGLNWIELRDAITVVDEKGNLIQPTRNELFSGAHKKGYKIKSTEECLEFDWSKVRSGMTLRIMRETLATENLNGVIRMPLEKDVLKYCRKNKIVVKEIRGSVGCLEYSWSKAKPEMTLWQIRQAVAVKNCDGFLCYPSRQLIHQKVKAGVIVFKKG